MGHSIQCQFCAAGLASKHLSFRQSGAELQFGRTLWQKIEALLEMMQSSTTIEKNVISMITNFKAKQGAVRALNRVWAKNIGEAPPKEKH